MMLHSFNATDLRESGINDVIGGIL